VNRPLLKPAFHPNKHLHLSLFLNERPLPNIALQPNRLKNPHPNGLRLWYPPPNLEKFLKRGVMRGKIVKIGYFREHELEVFLDKLKD